MVYDTSNDGKYLHHIQVKEVPIILAVAATIGVSIALGPILGGILTEYLNYVDVFI